ncbi:UPF0496 protein At3g19330 [Malania oleifera]|uniref:UPF0496 protein At3g19330 n=1 Tax=Malania oleifera TaxID=397392 RepID=UPI0025AE14CA|nr:UPF0496 protein At3g19330 [Malania oleifera]
MEIVLTGKLILHKFKWLEEISFLLAPLPVPILREHEKKMLQCLTFKSPSSSSANPPLPSSPLEVHNSGEDTPQSSSQASTTLNLTPEYNLAVHTSSYNEMWSKIHDPEVIREVDIGEDNDSNSDSDSNSNSDPMPQLDRLLHPSRECVQDNLCRAKSTTLTLVSTYFDQSEHASRLCLLLHRNARRARSTYGRLHRLLDTNIPLEDCPSPCPLTESQCHRAFDVFLQFDRLRNPFPSPTDSGINFHDMHRCFTQLKQQLDRRLRKSKSRISFLRRTTAGSSLCFIGTAVGIAIAAVALALHSMVALVAAGPLFSALVPSELTKKELAHIAQLDAAARGAYVLNNDLQTIDRLVARLYTAVEGDKLLVRLGLERGMDSYSIQEVAKQLRKNHLSFLLQLKDLDEHICLCFATVNRARSLLLRQIHLNS